MSASLWRRRYVATIALLRAVGHILDKVDGASNPELRRAIDAAYSELRAQKPEPKIFWSFIERERNLLLKEYRPEALRNFIVHATPRVPTATQPPEDRVTYLISSGPFKSRDPRIVIGEGIAWWREYLDEIDHAVRQPPN